MKTKLLLVCMSTMALAATTTASAGTLGHRAKTTRHAPKKKPKKEKKSEPTLAPREVPDGM